MKHILFAGLFFTLAFIACTKTSSLKPIVRGGSDTTATASTNDTTPYVAGPSTTDFVFNGTQVQITGGKDVSQRDQLSGNYYGCYALLPAGSSYCSISAEETNFGVLLGLHTQSAALIGAYSGETLTTYFFVNNVTYGVNTSADGIVVNITRYGNDSIDGNFSGMVSDNTGNEKTITSGKFTNLKMN
jgi:hypothetical protein